MKRSSASRRQAAGSIIVSVGDTVMGDGLGIVERRRGERESGGREVARGL